MKSLSIAAFVALAALALALPLRAAPPATYHLQLEAYPSAPFPSLGKFGTVTLHVYRGGVRAETLWLNGFSRNGAPAITVENPLGRMYTDVPLANIARIIGKLGASRQDLAVNPTLSAPVPGKVHGLEAMRYRIVYGPSAWIDLWTTSSLPDSPQLRTIINQFVRGISPSTASVTKGIPGLPLYVEINFSHYKKVPLLRVKSISFDNAGEHDALETGSLYFKAPLLDSIWK